MFKTDSEEVNFLNERYPHLDDSELKVENIKRRLDLLWKLIARKTTPAKVVKVTPVNPLPPTPKMPQTTIEPIVDQGDVHDHNFSFFKRADVSEIDDAMANLKKTEEQRAALAAVIAETIAKQK